MTPVSFSISMPIGAYHPFLRDAVESILAQDAQVDIAFLDASGDDRVRAIADKFDGRLAYRRHGPDKGQSDAIIEGWRQTKGSILGWLNADDILFPGALKKACTIFENNAATDLVYGNSTIINSDGATIGYHWAVDNDPGKIRHGGIISQPSCFFRRSAYDAAGGLDTNLHYTMDWDLWIRLYNNGAKFEFVDDVMSKVLWAQGTKTSSFNKARRDELRRIIETYTPVEKRKKIMRSFAIHNLMERLPSQSLHDLVSRLLIRGRKVINGVAGDGKIEDGAMIPLCHFDDQPRGTIHIAATNASAITHLDIGGEMVKVSETNPGVIRTSIPDLINKAKLLPVRLRTKPDQSIYIKSISLR